MEKEFKQPLSTQLIPCVSTYPHTSSVNLGKPVIAVEPNARNLHYLLKNIRDNEWANMAQVFPVALGGRTDILQMWGGGTGASLVKGWAAIPESYVTQVPVLSLDRVLGTELCGKKSLILIDVEGAELLLLQGAGKTLVNEPRPIWFVEISINEHQPEGTATNPNFLQTFEMFFNLGYRAYTADDQIREITKDNLEQILKGDFSLVTHNFVFR